MHMEMHIYECMCYVHTYISFSLADWGKADIDVII